MTWAASSQDVASGVWPAWMLKWYPRWLDEAPT